MRLGTRLLIFIILAVWGITSSATAFVQGPFSFYALRFLLGVAEAGLFPAMILYFTVWFPQLYRALAKAGALFLAVPSSFQRETGVAHWHALLRARAIENLSYVFAPAMCGDHPGNRMTYGHSLIIDPWGRIIAELGPEPGIAMADINVDEVLRVRGMLPSLEHDRAFSGPAV